MSKIVNLRTTKKNRERDAKRREADANARKFGRSKAQRELEMLEAEKSARDIDGHKRDSTK